MGVCGRLQNENRVVRDVFNRKSCIFGLDKVIEFHKLKLLRGRSNFFTTVDLRPGKRLASSALCVLPEKHPLGFIVVFIMQKG
jgi:hypothetical protein